MTDGYSTRSGTSCRSPDSWRTLRLTRPCRRCAFASSSREILLWRSLAFEDDEVLEQAGPVLVERPDLDRAAGAAAGGQKPMAVGDRARRHVLDPAGLRGGRSRDGERHHAAAIHIEHPADGTAKQQIALAVLEHRIPVHHLRERERAQRAAEHVGQHVHGGLAAQAPAVREVDALGRFDALERRHLHALLGRKAGRGRRGRAVGGKAPPTPAVR